MRSNENRILVPWSPDLGLGPRATTRERRRARELLFEAELERVMKALVERETPARDGDHGPPCAKPVVE